MIQKVAEFRRISLKLKEPLFIYGSDEDLLIAGISNNDTKSVRKLDEYIEALKRRKNECQSKEKKRGTYEK